MSGNFAILRIEKKSRMADIRGLAGHHLRTDPVPNCDPSRGIEVLIGPDNARDVTRLFKLRTDHLAKRKDSVRCIDIFVGMSPEWARANPDKLDEWKATAQNWVTDFFGESNVVTLALHRDETTPHLQGLITPIHQGKLQQAHWCNGKDKMRAMQDSFSAAMRPLGLLRGVQGSRARHERIQHWYGTLAPRISAAKAMIASADEVRAEFDEKAAQIARKAVLNERVGQGVRDLEKSYLARSKALDEEREKLQVERAEIERQKSVLREIANQLKQRAQRLTARLAAFDQAWIFLPAPVQRLVRQVKEELAQERRPARSSKPPRP
jgi:hypothetical protein